MENSRVITASVESSNIASISYDPDRTTAIVNFKNGTVYEYYETSLEQYEAFVKAESVGKHFNSEFKPMHPEFQEIEQIKPEEVLTPEVG